jgi:tRNA (guanine10-N2)-methyltransferase
MANMALAKKGSFILDPFVGTGSFLVSCSHFGALTIGSDIDGFLSVIKGRQIRGQSGPSIDSNVSQYKLKDRVIGQVVSDIAHHPWKRQPWFDAIVCDPPYGVRAGAKKISQKPLAIHKTPYKPYQFLTSVTESLVIQTPSSTK